jgi:outer membrane immunogenic protein
MKQIAIALLAGTALVSLSQVASAADMAVKAAPPPPPAPTWTGLYVGVHAGAAWQSTPDFTFNDPNGVIAPTLVNNAGGSALGAVGGLQAGYNWQFAAFVLGVEGDISWASLQDKRTVQPLVFGNALTPNTSVQMSANTQWLASARAKLGYVGLWNNTLWYVTGGAAWANISYSAQEANEPPTFATDFRSVASFNQTKTGWVVGGGAEWMATTNILLRAEYLYYNLNSGTNASANLFPNPGAFPVAFNYNWASYNVQVFRIAGSYKFNWF